VNRKVLIESRASLVLRAARITWCLCVNQLYLLN